MEDSGISRICRMSPGKSLNKQKSSNNKNSGNGESESIIATIYYVKCPVFIKKFIRHARKLVNF